MHIFASPSIFFFKHCILYLHVSARVCTMPYVRMCAIARYFRMDEECEIDILSGRPAMAIYILYIYNTAVLLYFVHYIITYRYIMHYMCVSV